MTTQDERAIRSLSVLGVTRPRPGRRTHSRIDSVALQA